MLDAGLRDPLPKYEQAFGGLLDEPTAWGRAEQVVAVRFLDPDGRRDAAGRLIPHEFVVLGAGSELINSVHDGERYLWPLVERAFEQVWEAETPPSVEELHFE